jgi:hypothetical protein
MTSCSTPTPKGNRKKRRTATDAPRTLSPLEALSVGLLPGAKVLEIVDMAALFGKSVSTIYHWRCRDPERLPPGEITVGTQVCWPVTATVGWQPPARPNRRGKWSRAAKRAAAAAIDTARRRAAGDDSAPTISITQK